MRLTQRKPVLALLTADQPDLLRWTPCSVSVVSSDYPHPLLLSVSVAVEVLLVLNTTTVSVDDPLSCLEAATVLGTHDFCLRGGAGQSNDCEQACNNNRSHSQYLSSFLNCLLRKRSVTGTTRMPASLDSPLLEPHVADQRTGVMRAMRPHPTDRSRKSACHRTSADSCTGDRAGTRPMPTLRR